MPPATPDLVLNGHVTDAGWGHIHALCKHSTASISFVAESMGIARSSVSQQLANPNPPSKRPARRPPAVPARNKLDIKERRRLVRKYTDMKIKRKCVQMKIRVKHVSFVTVHQYPSPTTVARKLWVSHGIKASRATVRRDHRAMGYRSYRAALRPRQWDDDAKNRLKFCKKHVRTPAKNKKIIFSDEKWFNTNWTGSRHYTDKKGPNRVPVVVPKQQGAPTCYFWGAIGVGVKHLVHIKKTKKKSDDDEQKHGITGAKYKRTCLIPSMRFLQGDVIFMQDGAKIHGTPENCKYLDSKGVTRLEGWPARSPDLNPIENAWAIISAKVARRCPWTEAEVAKFVIEEWNALPQAVVDKLVLSYTKRLRNVIKKKGGNQ
jgi:transposase